MKTKKIIKLMYLAIIDRHEKKQKKLWLKAIKKSLKHKHTEAIQ